MGNVLKFGRKEKRRKRPLKEKLEEEEIRQKGLEEASSEESLEGTGGASLV